MKYTAISKRCLLFMLICLCGIFAKQQDVSAAKIHGRIFEDYSEWDGTVKKDGKCYFKYERGIMYMSHSKHGAYVATTMQYDACGNGKKAYYVNCKDGALYEYTYAKRSSKKLKTIYSTKKELSASVIAVYGSNVYVEVGGMETFRCDTYIYNTKSKKITKKIKSCGITCVNGQYAVSEPSFRTDVSGSRQDLFKFTKNGLKKVKVLSKYGWCARKVGKYFYYIEYPEKYSNLDAYRMDKGVVYRCKANGSGKKKIVSISAKEENSQIIVGTVTGKYLEYYMDGKNYRYTFKTKKTTKIQ